MHKPILFWIQTALLVLAVVASLFAWAGLWIWLIPGSVQLLLALWDTIEPNHLFPTSQPKIYWYWMSVFAALGLWAVGVGSWVALFPMAMYEVFSFIVAFQWDLPEKRSKFLPNLKF